MCSESGEGGSGPLCTLVLVRLTAAPGLFSYLWHSYRTECLWGLSKAMHEEHSSECTVHPEQALLLRLDLVSSSRQRLHSANTSRDPEAGKLLRHPRLRRNGAEEGTRRQDWNEVACPFISLAETQKCSLPVRLDKACKAFLESIWEESIKNGNIFTWRSHH